MEEATESFSRKSCFSITQFKILSLIFVKISEKNVMRFTFIKVVVVGENHEALVKSELFQLHFSKLFSRFE